MNTQLTAIGFNLPDDDAIANLALQTAQLGKSERIVFDEKPYTVYRWQLGNDIELWAVIERASDQFAAFYPAFLGRGTTPFSISHVSFDAQIPTSAYLHGTLQNTPVEFFYTNLLTSHGWDWQPETEVQASLAGLAAGIQITRPESSPVSACFIPARDFRPEWDDPAEYAICGTITDFERMVNPLTDAELVWMKLHQTGMPDTEVVAAFNTIRGEIRRGMVAFAQCWLQGQVILPSAPPASNGANGHHT